MPGTKDALQRLQFCLERDADEYAVDRTRNPIALASAICKAAVDSPAPTPAGTPGRLINAGNGCAAADYAGAPAGDWIAVVTGHLGRSEKSALRARQRALTLKGFAEVRPGLVVRPAKVAYMS